MPNRKRNKNKAKDLPHGAAAAVDSGRVGDQGDAGDWEAVKKPTAKKKPAPAAAPAATPAAAATATAASAKVTIVNEVISVPRDVIPAIIGKGGSKIKGLEAESGARINVQRETNVVTVKGEAAQVAKAKELINVVVTTPKEERKAAAPKAKAAPSQANKKDGRSAAVREAAELEAKGISASKSGMKRMDLGQLMVQQQLRGGAPMTTTLIGAKLNTPALVTASAPVGSMSNSPAVQEAMQSLTRLEAGMNQQWEQARQQTASVFRRFETEVMVRRGEIERGMVLAMTKERTLLTARMDMLKKLTTASPSDKGATDRLTQFNQAAKADIQAWGKQRVAYDIFGMNANLKGFGTIADITTTQTPVISTATTVPAAGSGRTAPVIVPVGANKPASHSWKPAGGGGRADGAVTTSGDKPKQKQQRQKRGPRARNPKPPSGDGSGGSTA